MKRRRSTGEGTPLGRSEDRSIGEENRMKDRARHNCLYKEGVVHEFMIMGAFAFI